MKEILIILTTGSDENIMSNHFIKKKLAQNYLTQIKRKTYLFYKNVIFVYEQKLLN